MRSVRVAVLGILILLQISAYAVAQNESCNLDNVVDCSLLSTKKLTKQFPTIFSVNKDKLLIKAKDKSLDLLLLTETSFEDYPDDKLAYPIQYWSDKQWLLIKEFADGGESQDFAVINLANSFQKTQINGTPVFSPDGKKMLAYGADIYSRFSANGIAIYSIQDNQLHEIAKWDKKWGVVEAQWINDHEILISTIVLCDNNQAPKNENGECTGSKRLLLINNQWQLIH